MIAEIITGISAFAEIAITVITFPLQYLITKPENGEPQYSARRVAIAISSIVLIVAAVVGFVAWEKRKNHQQSQSLYNAEEAFRVTRGFHAVHCGATSLMHARFEPQ